jgi:preprotein translocase subunit SecE
MEQKTSLVQRVVSGPVRVKNYIQELQLEMRRVTWPSWKQVRATTGVVIAAVFAFAAYFAVVDLLLGRGINKIFDAFRR